MVPITEIGKEMLAFQERLAAEFHYKPIGLNLFLGDLRGKYKEMLPEWCCLEGDSPSPLFTHEGTRLCSGYTRIVIGDYGAFVEIAPEQIDSEVLCCKTGQEYRLQDDRYSTNVKYIWLTAKDRSDCKIYLQRKTVEYADYIPGMYYISPYEVCLSEVFRKTDR